MRLDSAGAIVSDFSIVLTETERASLTRVSDGVLLRRRFEPSDGRFNVEPDGQFCRGEHHRSQGCEFEQASNPFGDLVVGQFVLAFGTGLALEVLATYVDTTRTPYDWVLHVRVHHAEIF